MCNAPVAVSYTHLDVYKRQIKLLSASQFLNCASFFKLSFEFLQRFFNVFAFFYRYYNHLDVYKRQDNFSLSQFSYHCEPDIPFR